MLECEHCDFKSVSEKRMKTHVASAHCVQNKQVPSTDILPSTLHGSITTSYNIHACNNTNNAMTNNYETTVKIEKIEDDIEQQLYQYQDEDAVNNNYETTVKIEKIEDDIEGQLYQNVKKDFYKEFLVKNEEIDIKEDIMESEDNKIKIEKNADVKKNIIVKEQDASKLHCHKSDTAVQRVSKLYKCHNCDYSAKLRLNLNKHIDRMHNNHSVTYFCDHCDYTSVHSGNLTIHMERIHNDGSVTYSCDHCDYTSVSKYNLGTHLYAKHNNSIHACNKCDYKSLVKANLTRHVERMHNDGSVKYSCDHCDFISPSINRLGAHKFKKHKATVHACDKCDFKGTRTYLTDHIDRKHNDGSVTYSCKHCDFTNVSKGKLKDHRRKHRKDKDLTHA